MMRTRTAYCAVLGLLLAACGAGEPEQGGRWRGTVEQLPGGGRRVINPATGMWGPGEAWRLRESFRIGRVEGDGPDLFGRIEDLAVDDLGRVYVLEAQAREIRVFDAAGKYVRTIGRPGPGPGEFSLPLAVEELPGGRLLVVDHRNARYSVFDTAGTFLTSAPRRVDQSSLITPWRGAVDRQGRIYEWSESQPASGVSGGILIRTDSTFAPRDTFDLALPEIANTVTVLVRGGVMQHSIPFAPWLRWWLDADRGHFWTSGSPDYRLVQASIAGDTLMVVERAHEPIPVRPHERDSVIARLDAAVRSQVASRIPRHKPAFSSFVVDPEGFLWVIPFLESGMAFDVFDPEGRYLGRVPSPVELKRSPVPVVTAEAIYGVVQDELGVEYVVRLEIERPS